MARTIPLVQLTVTKELSYIKIIELSSTQIDCHKWQGLKFIKIIEVL